VYHWSECSRSGKSRRKREETDTIQEIDDEIVQAS